MKHSQVAEAWVNGKRATSGNVKVGLDGSTNFTRMRTDGKNLYSYSQLIGVTLENGHKALLQSRHSVATKHHVQTAWSALWKVTGHVPELGVNLFAPRADKSWATFPQEVLDKAV